jgi:hypothetical protein
MDRTRQTSAVTRPFSRGRAVIALVAAVTIIAVASWIVRTYPNSGYRAGYEATTAKGEKWVRAEVDAAGVSAQAVCAELHDEAEQSPGEPRYERESFIRGCAQAVDHLYGRHVPMAPVPGYEAIG